MAFNIQPMRGTTNSKFTLFAVTENARIGYRQLGNGHVRVRVEPVDGASFTFPDKWNSPQDGHPRYSIVVSEDHYKVAMLDAFRIVSGINLKTKLVTVEVKGLPGYGPDANEVEADNAEAEDEDGKDNDND